ncbi:MAG: DoxX family protein [Steroidobacteraceae bacterium]
MSPTAAIAVTVAIRYLLVALFFPFSALDKILNFRGAVAQAMQVVPALSLARVLILAGLAIEIVMPLAILTGVADRVAAVILAGYCGVTAILWKPFWRPGDFWHAGKSEARDLFWDFLKNFALAGGFLLITFGTTASAVSRLVAHPEPMTHAYGAQVLADPPAPASPRQASP